VVAELSEDAADRQAAVVLVKRRAVDVRGAADGWRVAEVVRDFGDRAVDCALSA
jgi:hypothetical protein